VPESVAGSDQNAWPDVAGMRNDPPLVRSGRLIGPPAGREGSPACTSDERQRGSAEGWGDAPPALALALTARGPQALSNREGNGGDQPSQQAALRAPSFPINATSGAQIFTFTYTVIDLHSGVNKM
jgi:hypothetical protein